MLMGHEWMKKIKQNAEVFKEMIPGLLTFRDHFGQRLDRERYELLVKIVKGDVEAKDLKGTRIFLNYWNEQAENFGDKCPPIELRNKYFIYLTLCESPDSMMWKLGFS